MILATNLWRSLKATLGLAAVAGAATATIACAPESETDAEALGVAAAAAGEAERWEEVGAMLTARARLVGAPLNAGRFLVAGGEKPPGFDIGGETFNTAEVFDPQAGTFSEAGTMLQHRTRHVAAQLAGNRVLVIGGIGDASSLKTSELYAAQIDAWGSLAPLAHPRANAAAVTLADGRVLVCGGSDSGFPPTLSGPGEIFDVTTGVWAETGTMNVPRQAHVAVLLGNGRVLVAGGFDAQFARLTSAEIWNPATGTWTEVAPMPVARADFSAVRLQDGRVLVTGGAGAEAISEALYNAATNTWIDVPPMNTPRSLHALTRLTNGAVIATGGVDATSSALRSTELFDPDALAWFAVEDMGHDRYTHVAMALPQGELLVAGGELQSSAEVYSPAPIGVLCLTGKACASGFCVDGVCCADACEGACRTCNREDSPGACQGATPGTDPRHDCGGGAPCDDVCGADGACVDRVGEVCSAGACSEDGLSGTPVSVCASPGGACDATPVSCGAFRCGDREDGTKGCLDACRSVDDCAPGYACSTKGVCMVRPEATVDNPNACSVSAAGRMESNGGTPARAIALGIGLAAIMGRRRRSRAGRSPR